MFRGETRQMGQRATKSTIRLLRPANTQISPCIRWAVFDRMCLLQPSGYPKRGKWEILLYWVDVLADLCWVHRSDCRFRRAMAHSNQYICNKYFIGSDVYFFFFFFLSIYLSFLARLYEVQEELLYYAHPLHSPHPHPRRRRWCWLRRWRQLYVKVLKPYIYIF